MITTTTDFIPDKEITEILGIARGSTVRARNFGSDFMASLKNLVGGEVNQYTKLQAHSREQALKRMLDDAEKLGADAVINVRFTTSMIMQGMSEILAYGTAVKIK
ncbi:MAG TPA: YbjQ family protein [Flavobacteriales bacterium]|jgi:uncharacterized protein YbjQ (UPF0145 family)|nr:YbjQ family protein [Flavobacteriales bacterium]